MDSICSSLASMSDKMAYGFEVSLSGIVCVRVPVRAACFGERLVKSVSVSEVDAATDACVAMSGTLEDRLWVLGRILHILRWRFTGGWVL